MRTARAAVFLGVIALIAIQRDLEHEVALEWAALVVAAIYVVVTSIPAIMGDGEQRLNILVTTADVILISALIYVTGGMNSQYYPVYYLPVLQAAVRLSLRDAIAAAVLGVGFYALVAFAPQTDSQPELAWSRARTFGGISMFVAILCGILMRETRAHRQRVIELDIIHEISKRAQATLAVDDLLASVVTSIHSNFPYAQVSIHLRDKGTGDLRVEAHAPSEAAGDVSPLVASACQQVVGTGQLALRENGEGGEALCVPLRAAETTVGVLAIEAGSKGSFNTQMVSLAETLAEAVSGSLKNARLYEDTLLGAMRALSSAIDAKHPYTHGHTQRVTEHAMYIAHQIGMPKPECDDLELAALLHDVGKIGSPESLLDKPGKLTDEEWEIIREHPGRGGDMIANIAQMEKVAAIIRHHHERWDGKGYPDGLSGEQIPLGARILALADAFDAMTTERAYKPAYPPEQAFLELRRCGGSQFDPSLVEAACSWSGVSHAELELTAASA
ncbi:MAG: GAF and HD-GYP domain-containing protein [Armatimonadota bacterium]